MVLIIAGGLNIPLHFLWGMSNKGPDGLYGIKGGRRSERRVRVFRWERSI